MTLNSLVMSFSRVQLKILHSSVMISFQPKRLGLALLPAKTAGAIYTPMCLSGSHFGFLCMNKNHECSIERRSSGGFRTVMS